MHGFFRGLFFGVRNMRTVTTETREATGSAVSGWLVDEVVQSGRVEGFSRLDARLSLGLYWGSSVFGG